MSITFIVTNIIILFAFFIRSFSGFGGALLAIPLLSLFYELKFIVPMECTFEVILSLVLVPRILKDIDKRDLLFLLSGALLGSIAGIYLLKSFANEALRIALGVIIVLVSLNLLRVRPDQSKSMAPKWGIIAGVIGGILGGMFGTSGPAYVTYLSYQTSKKHVLRSTLIMLFAIEYTWRLGFFIWQGLYTAKEFKFALSLTPAVLIATIAGHLCHFRVNERVFQLVIAGLLFISGLLCFLNY